MVNNLATEKTFNNYNKYIYLFILLIPLWWLLGLKVIVFHIFVTALFLNTLWNQKRLNIKFRISPPMVVLLSFIVVYSFSLLLSLYSQDFSRVFGSFYNLTYWILGFMLMYIIQNLNYSPKRWIKIFNAFRWLGLLQGLLTVIALLYWLKGEKVLVVNSVLVSLLPGSLRTRLINSSMELSIVGTDWFLNVPFPRVSGFFLYPTALGIGMVVIISMSLIYYQIQQTSYIKRFFEMGLMSLPLIFSLSRTVYIGLIFSIIVVKLFTIKKKKDFLIFTSLGAFILAALVPFLYFKMGDVLTSILSSREGSSELRGKVYKIAIETALKQNPILGIGVKPYLENIHISIGSHSTIVGTFLKTGIFGLALLLLFKLITLFYLIRLKKLNKEIFYLWDKIAISYITLSIWMVTEDIDAPQIVAFMYFFICGLIIMLGKNSKKNFTKEKVNEDLLSRI
ncbi:hypothetical protein GOICGAJE_02520 [Bacillus sp. MB95]|nr:hypothetical protein [Bacillus sp. MB95]